MQHWELAAREAIRDTIARYNHAGDRGRFDEMVATFLPGGVLELDGSQVSGGGRHEGRDALRDFFSHVGDDRGMTVLRHCVTNTLIDVASPREATARSYFTVLTDIGVDHWGTYHDRLEPVGARWLLAHRSVRTAAHAPGSFFV